MGARRIFEYGLPLFDRHFVIEGTDTEMAFNEIAGSEKYRFRALDPLCINLTSKKCPRLTFCAEIEYVGHWYISLDGRDFWKVSDEFLEFLKENKII